MSLLTCANSETELARIDSLIATTRRTLRFSWMLTGAALCVGIALATISVAISADLLVPLTMPLRLAALCAIVLPTLLTLIAAFVRPAARRLSANHIARRIERLVPHIQSRLVTTLDIGHDPVPGSSAAFRQRLISETSARVGDFRLMAVVDRDHVRRAALFALAALLIFSGLFVCFGERLPTTLARIFLPFADIPPATGVRFSAKPGDAKSLKGDDLTIAAMVQRGDPRDMTLEFRPVGGKWTRQPMQRTAPDQFEATLIRLDQSIDYRLVGGRTWTTRNTIEVIERPAIVDIQTVVRYPEYMKLPEPKIGLPHSADATGPVASRVEVVVDVAGQATSGEIQLLTPVASTRPVLNRTERVWFEGKIPDGARAEGNWQWDFALKFRAAHTEPPAGGAHAHGFLGATTGFEVRSDDVIYAYVHVVPGQIPEEIMLQFHDGKDWEHRAFWGADKIQSGIANTSSRFRIGEMPPAGEWIRLEVPAKAVGLAGKKLHGISFMLFGGQCKWNRAGAMDPASIIEREFVVQAAVAMKRDDAESALEQIDNSAIDSNSKSRTPRNSTARWSGSFLLNRDGFYRVAFQNELGYSNKQMQEGQLGAIPDNPPQVMLERPGTDLVLSQPQRVPLVIRATDDFGLSDISLAVQKGDSGGFVGAPLKTYDDPVRADSVLAAFDLEPYQLKQGEFVRYHVQARDRKGQIAQTQELVVRIQQDNNAADKQLAAATQQQNALQRDLEQLIKQQAKITATLDRLTGREPPPQPDAVRSQTAQEQANDSRSAVSNGENPANPTVPKKSPPAAAPVNPEMMASELKQELSKLAAPQDANIQLATQVQNQLTQATTQATNSKLVPQLLAAQMHTAEQLFNTEALQPMRDLLQSMRNAGDPQKPTPSTAAMADSAQRIQQQLESMRARLDALARAQQNMKNDPSAALAQLRMDLMAQNAQLTAQELGELRDFLDRLTGQMKMLEGRENELARHTKQAMPVVLPEIDKEQGQIESDAEKLLAQTDQILQTENMRDMKRLLRLPNDTAAKSAAEREERSHHAPRDDQPRHSPDSGPPEFSSAEMKSAKASQRKHGLRTEEDEEMFTPPGVKQKNGPRATKTARSNGMESDDQTTSARQRAEASRAQPPMAEPRQSSHADSVRDQLARRQERTAQQLQEGQEKLQPPRDRIAQLLERLREAFGPENDEAIQQLAKVMQSMDMQHAMQLAQAARRARQQAERATGQLSQQPQATPQAQGTAIELNTAMRAGIASEFEANDLGLAAQAVLLRLQPRVREELLKGMREEGPEAYRKFIEEYFNRLTKIKTPSVQGN